MEYLFYGNVFTIRKILVSLSIILFAHFICAKYNNYYYEICISIIVLFLQYYPISKVLISSEYLILKFYLVYKSFEYKIELNKIKQIVFLPKVRHSSQYIKIFNIDNTHKSFPIKLDIKQTSDFVKILKEKNIEVW